MLKLSEYQIYQLNNTETLENHIWQYRAEHPKPVLTKRDFTIRYEQGEFGNASPTWHNPTDFATNAPASGLYHLRNRVASGLTYYDLNKIRTYASWITQTRKDDWYVSEMAPTEKTILQGEVMETERGLYLYYSTVAKPMRDALKEMAASEYGILARFRLKSALCPNSYEWLMELLRRYPNHVVEFSAYSVKWGTLYPRFNTCFWECRLY